MPNKIYKIVFLYFFLFIEIHFINIYIIIYNVNHKATVCLFVSDVGPGSPSAALSHSQRSLESKSMESFFSSRSEMFIQTYA